MVDLNKDTETFRLRQTDTYLPRLLIVGQRTYSDLLAAQLESNREFHVVGTAEDIPTGSAMRQHRRPDL